MSKLTLCCNLFGSPGSGKSTMAALVFSRLKILGVNCELVTEFAKDKTWEKNFSALSNQVYVFAKQYFRMDRCADQVDVIITDSPLALSPYYNKDPDIHKPLCELAVRISNKFNNLNYFIRRVKKYNPIGRNQTEDESNKIAVDLKNMLKDYDIPYVEVDGDLLSADKIVDDVMIKLEQRQAEKEKRT